MAAGFVGPDPYTPWAARICDSFLRTINTSVDVSSTIESATLTWNGDVTTESIIGVLVKYVSIRCSTRLADHCVVETLACRGCDGSVRESWIGFLLIGRIILVEAICKFLLMMSPSAIITRIIFGIQNL